MDNNILDVNRPQINLGPGVNLAELTPFQMAEALGIGVSPSTWCPATRVGALLQPPPLHQPDNVKDFLTNKSNNDNPFTLEGIHKLRGYDKISPQPPMQLPPSLVKSLHEFQARIKQQISLSANQPASPASAPEPERKSEPGQQSESGPVLAASSTVAQTHSHSPSHRSLPTEAQQSVHALTGSLPLPQAALVVRRVAHALPSPSTNEEPVFPPKAGKAAMDLIDSTGGMRSRSTTKHPSVARLVGQLNVRRSSRSAPPGPPFSELGNNLVQLGKNSNHRQLSRALTRSALSSMSSAAQRAWNDLNRNVTMAVQRRNPRDAGFSFSGDFTMNGNGMRMESQNRQIEIDTRTGNAVGRTTRKSVGADMQGRTRMSQEVEEMEGNIGLVMQALSGTGAFGEPLACTQ